MQYNIWGLAHRHDLAVPVGGIDMVDGSIMSHDVSLETATSVSVSSRLRCWLSQSCSAGSNASCYARLCPWYGNQSSYSTWQRLCLASLHRGLQVFANIKIDSSPPSHRSNYEPTSICTSHQDTPAPQAPTFSPYVSLPASL